MKVCKKCKKKVANKSKICKYCGADVSKCKIIKNTNSNVGKKVATKNTIDVNSFDSEKKTTKVNKIQEENKAKVVLDKTVDEIHMKDKNKSSNDGKNTRRKSKNQVKNNKNVLPDELSKKAKHNESKIKIEEKSINYDNKIKKIGNFIIHYKLFGRINLWIIIILVLVIVGGSLIYFTQTEDNQKENTQGVFVSSSKEVFEMNDIIEYKGVNYKVIDIQTSMGNSYKEPEEGNQFIIVTVSIENNTDEKIAYSYNNWTVSNSDSKEDAKRIFSSINVDNALYSGKLVVGGVKKGSMVFEQPIDAKDVTLNYYELKKDDEGMSIIDEDKKIFSIKLEIPKDDNSTSNDSNNIASEEKK